MATKEQYFNFPIQLLNGFLLNSKACLDDICDYALYVHASKLEFDDEIKRIKSSAKYYNLTLGNPDKVLKNGEGLYLSIQQKSPNTGINLTMFWDYYTNHKTDFEKVCLLGFLAIKSILQKKAYCKITNNYWLSRMDGNPCALTDNLGFSDEIQRYNNEYQMKKIKTELRDNWNLVTYSRYTRGFYVSFKLKLEQLIFEAEKRRKSTIEKQYKFTEKQALERVLSKLNPKPS